MRIASCLATIGAGLCVSAGALAAAAHEVSIRMQQQTFVPVKIEVAVGTKITWTNNDTQPHSVTANDGLFDSGAILPGKAFQWTTTQAGTIGYHCIFHPSMTADLTVK